MPTFDSEALIALLKIDIHRCMTAFRAKRPNETFYAFVLYTDGDAVTVSAYANTIEAFDRALKVDSGAAWTRWAPDEWEFLDDENYMGASQVIVGNYDGFEGEDFVGRKRAGFGAFATALSQLRDEGLFDPQIALFVSISDAGDDELDVMRQIIHEINPRPLARKLSHAINWSPQTPVEEMEEVEGLFNADDLVAEGAETDFDDEDEDRVPMYETQEFIFYLGDRKLGSFFMPEVTATPEPIIRRLITAPTKTSMGGHPALLWLEDTDKGSGTIIWTADTPEEVQEAERLYNAAHGLGGDDEATAFTPVLRSAEERRLLQAILDAVDDTQPLLDYADWLAAQQNPQGEFIRVAVEADILTRDDPRFDSVNARWAELLEEHGESWYAPLSAMNLFPYDRSFWMSKGVIHEVEINRPSLLTERAAQLFDAVPLLDTLSFDCENLDVSQLAGIPQMAQIRSLDFRYVGVDPDQLAVLLQSPFLRNVVALDLGGNEPGNELVRAVIDSPVWPQLRTLNLGSCNIDDEGLELIAASDESLELRELNLDESACTAEGLGKLAECASLEKLTSLSLENVELTGKGVAALAKAAWVPQLESLVLKNQPVDGTLAAELVRWPVKALRKLDLSGCELDDETLTRLLQSNLLTGVENLELLSNKLTDQGIIALAQSPSMGNLQYLELSTNPFGAEGVTALANSPYLSKLGELKLGSVDIGTQGVQALVNSPYLQKIYWLWIGTENGLTDADHQQLRNRFQDAAAGF